EISWAQAEAGVKGGAYDLVLCLALPDVQVVQGWQVPRLFVMLNMIGTDSGKRGAQKQAYVESLKPLFREIDLAFISEKKRRDWGWEAPVVVSGIDPDLYGGYTGELDQVLRVGNMLVERDHMQGFSIQEAILGDQFPSAIVGINPTLPQARPSASWEDLKEQYRRHRLLLNTLTEEHEDGYNLAMLEAMATGMPVVSTPNSSAPVADGENGFISGDLGQLRERIRQLLADVELARQLGQRARQTVVERFNIEACATGWNEVFAQCVARCGAPAGATPRPRSVYPAPAPAPAGKGRRLKILLAAPGNPLSTSAYYERALRRGHEVLTCGPRLDEAMLGQWKNWEDRHALKATGSGDVDKMGLLARLVRENDLPLPWGRVEGREVAARLPRGWRPDLVLWVDAGADFLLTDPGAFDCPTVALVGDTHTGQRQWRIEYARQFSQVFLMFARQHIPDFVQGGCARVDWLPAACEPQIHRCFGVPKAYDVVFAGQTLRQWHPDRVRLLERLQAAGFDLRVESKILEEMALLFSRGRLVFNRSLNADLNMRVFEALSCGSLLLTDRLPAEAGLEELFADRKHLVLYGEDDLEELARYYVENEAEREQIAAEGRRLALERHTYGHRADQVLAAVFGEGACVSCVAGDKAAVAPAQAEAELPAYFRNRRPELAALVPDTARRILEVGCAAGELGRHLQERQPGVEVVGVELNPQAADLARRHLARVIEGNIEELPFLPFAEGYFDCVVLGDVLEHLRDPEAVLRQLLAYLHPVGCVVCSIPNIRHQSVMLDLMVNGRWRYRDEGLLDRTHLRFFTRIELGELLDRLGLCAEATTASTSPPAREMEPFFQAVAGLGGDAEVLRQESRVIQYIFRAVRKVQPTPAAGPRASIVIPLFNKAELTEECLLALARNTGDNPDYEVVAVDNGSTDWTPYLLHAFEGDIRVLGNDQNLGFARACNQGAQAAQGEYVVLLNNDTLPQPGWLAALVRLADSDPRIGVVGARLLYPGTRKVQHAGLEMVKGIPEHVYRGGDAEDPRVIRQRDLDMVTGACMLVRRDLYLKLGGLDSEYVNGVEDVDLCLRVRQAGYRVVYCPESVVEHHEGASEGRFDRVRENLHRFQQKWGRSFDAAGRFITGAPSAKPLRGNWEGGFFVYSSLAHANRELVLALLGRGGCELGLIHSEAQQFGAEAEPRFAPLAQRLGRLGGEVDFHLRHCWPPDFSRPASGVLILIQPWEFGRIPRAWVQPLQEKVDQVWAYTSYVRQCYLDSGIAPEKVQVVPLGVDPERFRPGLDPLPLATQKRFKFLFVGGTLYRKGIDLLLEAYCRVFSARDEVCLVIKDMGVNTFYRNQNAGERIRHLQQNPANPEILYLTEDLPGVDLPRLYAACGCLVHPYRGEGFGLPVAEAMACGLPAILTRGGACDDFCPEEAGYWVEAQRRQVRFEQETAGPAWLLEPDLEMLQAQLRQVYADPRAAGERGKLASRHVRTHFTWERAAARARQMLEDLVQPPVSPAPAALSQDDQAALHLEEADRCRQRRDWRQAALACEKAVAAKPDFVEGIMVWADVLIEEGQAAQAVGVIARLVDLDPNSSMAHNYLGLVQSKARQWAAAGASFRRALELEPRFAEALVNLGVWAWEQGRAQEALGYFKEAAQLDPANRELVANLALLQVRVGQPAEAVAVLRHYLSGHPADAELQGQLAEVLRAIAEQKGGKKEKEG
ncbi:MAG: glycosyltransferase, partial [Candidatus Latescibacteria bacterium]|nr:glycosyltransferase [Candidatus Latescibacterota bacterium]